MTSRRDPTFDIMKGIGILLVLLGHIYEWKTLGHFIYSFHMPLFFIVAGYFTKAYNEVANPWETIRTYARRLLVPFLAVGVLNILWFLFIGVTKHDWSPAVRMSLSYLYSDTTDWETAWGPLHLGITWFLLALFWAKSLFLWLSRWRKWCLFVTLMLALAALLVHHFVPHTPWCLLLALTALPLVALGYAWRHMAIPQWVNWLLLACWVAALLFSELDMYGYNWGIWPLSIAGACGGTWLVYLLSRVCADHTRWISKGLSLLGVYSLAIVCFHDFETTTHMGNHLRVLLGLDFSMVEMYLWRYALTLLLAIAAMNIPGVKRLFR